MPLATCRLPLLSLAAFSLLACGDSTPLGGVFSNPSPHERYTESLRDAGLDSTVLGREWLRVSEHSLQRALPVETPFSESGYFPPEKANALGYRFDARKGQRIVVSVELQRTGPVLVFGDLFELAGDSATAMERVASADTVPLSIQWEPRRDASFIFRLQPELLRSARFTLEISIAPSLAFPVSGKDSRAIRSRFGTERDAGTRQHQGVDIFAPRGTPAVAATDGLVRSVGTSALGGLVVWLWDVSRGQALYYAHLDTQLVQPGTFVRAGDTLGLVGNTGNARTTQPHLHFGIYQRGYGAIDPYPYVHASRGPLPVLTADTSTLGDWVRSSRDALVLRESPDGESPSIDTLARYTALRVISATGRWYRVELPDLRVGYIEATRTEPVSVALRKARLDEQDVLRDSPQMDATIVDSLRAAVAVPVLARFGDFLFVKAPSGTKAWVQR